MQMFIIFYSRVCRKLISFDRKNPVLLLILQLTLQLGRSSLFHFFRDIKAGSRLEWPTSGAVAPVGGRFSFIFGSARGESIQNPRGEFEPWRATRVSLAYIAAKISA